MTTSAGPLEILPCLLVVNGYSFPPEIVAAKTAAATWELITAGLAEQRHRLWQVLRHPKPVLIQRTEEKTQRPNAVVTPLLEDLKTLNTHKVTQTGTALLPPQVTGLAKKHPCL
jgi:hypothetical protein